MNSSLIFGVLLGQVATDVYRVNLRIRP